MASDCLRGVQPLTDCASIVASWSMKRASCAEHRVRRGDADAAAAAMRQQFTGVRSLLNLTDDARQPPLR